MKSLLLGLLVVMTGCAAPRTVFVDRPVEHRTEVSRPCLQHADVPADRMYATLRLSAGASDGDVVLAMLEEISEREADQAALLALLRGCIGKQVPEIFRFN